MRAPRPFGLAPDTVGDLSLTAAADSPPALPLSSLLWWSLLPPLEACGARFPVDFLNGAPGVAWDAGACRRIAEAARRLVAVARAGYTLVEQAPAPHLARVTGWTADEAGNASPLFADALSTWRVDHFGRGELAEVLLGLSAWFDKAAEVGGARLEAAPPPPDRPGSAARVWRGEPV